MTRRKLSTKKYIPLIVIVAIALAVVAVVTPTLAYYLRTTDGVSDSYAPAKPGTPTVIVDTRIDENEELKDVSVQVEDEGYPVYVRARIVVNWLWVGPEGSNVVDADDDDERIVYFEKPHVDIDYSLTINTDVWKAVEDVTADGTAIDDEQIDYVYYCTIPVASGGTSAVFIESLKYIEGVTPPEKGFVLSIEVIVQTIQAVGVTDKGGVPAWRDAWGISEMPK